MGLLLKVGINIDLIKIASIAFSSISICILLINFVPILKKRFPSYTLQLGGLIGNTSFLGIPIAIALLPTSTINFTIGFDLGTTLFAWIFGPFFLQKTNQKYILNLKGLSNALFNSPASRGIIGVLIAYLFGLNNVLGDYLWVPARIVIILAIIVVGSRLGIISNTKNEIIKVSKGIKESILLKILIFPIIIFIVSKFFNFNSYQTAATVLQAGTPSAISTILMAEAYNINQRIAAKILFKTTLISIITIPSLFFLITLYI